MLARYVRVLLVFELAACAALGYWLHVAFGWSYPVLAALAVAVVALSRLAFVVVSTSLGFIAGSPTPATHRIGIGDAAAMVLRECRAVLANNYFCLPWPEHALRRDPEAEPTARIPVILVHGYFGNRGYFRALVRNLEARGVRPLFAPTFRAAFATIEDFVVDLHAEIERVGGATPQGKVVLICHSMGGLAARSYLCEHGSGRVRKLITVSSPHHGTVHALLGAGANARQMRRGSAFIVDLCEKEARRAHDCRVTSIYSTHDNLVAPQETSRLAWAKNVALPGLGHLEILGSGPLAALLLEELREAGVESDG
jgi:predicted alpha/beta hydrolase family esterase